MFYGKRNKKNVREELLKKGSADEGLIAWGKLGSKAEIHGGIEGANSKFYALTKAGDEMLFIPYSKSGVYYKNVYILHKSKMKNLQVGGFGIFTILKLTTFDGHEKIYHITSGRKALKKIVESFGF